MHTLSYPLQVLDSRLVVWILISAGDDWWRHLRPIFILRLLAPLCVMAIAPELHICHHPN